MGSHLVEVSIAGQKLPAGPLVAKVYNSSLIQVTDVPSAVVGHACQFRGKSTHLFTLHRMFVNVPKIS